MEQLELLWAFMQEDMKAERIVNEIKRSPLRQKAEKARDLYFEQQKASKQLEEQVAVLVDRKDAIRDAIKRCEEQVKALTERVSANPPETLEDTQALIAEAEKYRRNIANYEAEMKRISKQGNDHTGRAQKIRVTAATAKKDFDQYKAEYEAESREKKVALEKAREVVASKSQGIPEALMSQYSAIKKHVTPPMARLTGGTCSGCNTSQPSALLRKIEAGTDIVLCETCGRMLMK